MELDGVFDFTNSLNNIITLTAECPKEKNVSLNTTSNIKDLYCKPTDTHQYHANALFLHTCVTVLVIYISKFLQPMLRVVSLPI